MGRTFKTKTVSAVKRLKGDGFLIDGILPRKAAVLLFGPEASRKTFVVLDMVHCVVNGVPYHGRRVQQGRAVVVAAEGGAPLGKRIRAWEAEHGVETREYALVWEAVNLDDAETASDFIHWLKEVYPYPVDLVVFDTLALCRGEDENGAREMGITNRSIKRIIEEVGCTVLLVHHSNRASGDAYRGSGALSAAMQTRINVQVENDLVVMDCQKMKDYAEFDDLLFEGVEIELGTVDEVTGRVETSLVLREVDETQGPSFRPTTDHVRVVEIVKKHGPVKRADVVSMAKNLGFSQSKAYRIVRDVSNHGLVLERPEDGLLVAA
jgi:RecA/RadA recombinase